MSWLQTTDKISIFFFFFGGGGGGTISEWVGFRLESYWKIPLSRVLTDPYEKFNVVSGDKPDVKILLVYSVFIMQ